MGALTFLGAAGTVTGSKYLLESDHHRVLVDCGLFQGLKSLRERNWAAVARPSRVGRRRGPDARASRSLRPVAAAGRRTASAAASSAPPARRTSCKLVLPDAAQLQEEDARARQPKGYSKHTPALPLFTENDAADALARLQPVGYDRPMPVAPGPRSRVHQRRPSARFGVRAGHASRRHRQDDPLWRRPGPLRPPGPARSGAWRRRPTCCSSNRPTAIALHDQTTTARSSARIVNETADRKGKVIIPAFAIGRVEEVLYWLKQPRRATGGFRCCRSTWTARWRSTRCSIYRRHVSTSSTRTCSRPRRRGLHALRAPTRLRDGRARVRRIDRRVGRRIDAGRAIVISASGMATGGRVSPSPAAALPDPRNTVLFVGYQAAGTRGRQLVDGARPVEDPRPEVPVARADREARLDVRPRRRRTKSCSWLGRFTRRRR